MRASSKVAVARRLAGLGLVVWLLMLYVTTAYATTNGANRLPQAEITVARFAPQVVGVSDSPATVHFQLPLDATQGPKQWYVLRLRLKLHWSGATNAAGGVAVDTNGKVVGQVEHKVGAVPRDRSVFYSGLVSGSVTAKPTSAVTLVEYDNYLQLEGIRGGANTMTLRVLQYRGQALKGVQILEDTKVYRTQIQPNQIQIGVPGRELIARVGQELQVRYTIRDLGQRQPRPVSVRVEPSNASLSILTGAEGRVSRVGEVTERTVKIKPAVAGDFSLLVRGDNGVESPAAAISLRVLPRDGTWKVRAGAVTFLAVSLVFGLTVRHRHRMSSGHGSSGTS